MLLSGALFALFITGFWLYCLTDAILTPATECRGLTKSTWIAVIAVTFIVGALGWLIVRRPARDSPRSLGPVARWNPDGSETPAAPRGPDDDQGFLRELDRAIHGDWQADGDA